MNINDLTIGQVKELAVLFGNTNATQNTVGSIYESYIGRYVICRSRNEGVNAGKVIAIDETGVVLEDCRRLWYHKPINKNASWYEGVAQFGISIESKVGVEVEKVIAEDYSLTVCTTEAEKTIREAKNHEQS